MTTEAKQSWTALFNVAWKVGSIVVVAVAFLFGKVQQDSRQDTDIVALRNVIELQSRNIQELAATVKSDHEFILKVEGAREARDRQERQRTRNRQTDEPQ